MSTTEIKTISEKEAFLKIIPQIGRYLSVLKAQAQDLDLMLCDAPIAQYDKIRVQSEMKDPAEHWSDIVERKRKLQKKIRFMENSLLDIYEKTLEAINKLEDLDERSILYYKYFKTDAPLSDDQLGKIFCLARTTIYSKRKQALKDLKIPKCISWERLCALERLPRENL